MRQSQALPWPSCLAECNQMQEVLNWGGEKSDSARPGRLLAVRPEEWPVSPDWRPLVHRFWASEAGLGLLAFLQQRLLAKATIYPPQPLRALALTPLAGVRVVILGQDPYHGEGQAEGLAFSVAPGVKLPPSLRNIFKESQQPGASGAAPNGSLVRWAEQGVLLLNTCLTVEDAAPASHVGQGWEVLTDQLIQACSEDRRPKVFMFWGTHAQKKRALIDAGRHRVLVANHPSPLSASRGSAPFLGCGHFVQANRWLEGQGQTTICW